MRVRIRKWGDGLGIRISRRLARRAGLTLRSEVIVTVERGRLVIRPAGYSLKSLVSRITSKNRHPETDWGGPVGREQI